MGIDNDLFLQALGAGGTDAVHGQCFDHGCTDVTGHAAQRGEGHDDQRQGEVVHLIPELIPCRPVQTAGSLHTGNGEPTQNNRKQPDKDDRDDKGGQGVADDGTDLHSHVALTAAPDCTENTQRDGNTQTQNGCENIDKDGILHGLDQNLNNRLAELGGVAEVTLQQTIVSAVGVGIHTDPTQISFKLRTIRSVPMLPVLIPLFVVQTLVGGNFVTGSFCSLINRQHVVNHKQQEREDEEDKNNIQDSFNYIFAHLGSSNSIISIICAEGKGLRRCRAGARLRRTYDFFRTHCVATGGSKPPTYIRDCFNALQKVSQKDRNRNGIIKCRS